MKVVRVLVYEGSKEWIKATMEWSRAHPIQQTNKGSIKSVFISEPALINVISDVVAGLIKEDE